MLTGARVYKYPGLVVVKVTLVGREPAVMERVLVDEFYMIN